ncbi:MULTISPECIES: hypothetical protein [Pseudomonas]|uniref:Uncharacterized protein ORF5 n=2 Tax=root TaxID=1 RepID=B7SDW8_9CAUD|nr:MULTISPECIES: hypothetical protein [Pseudomonas]YP_002332317.1 hypothetical protein PPMP38_gp05 [Pseudomonas phage MP38]ACA57701.1 hypothetical protein [Pseudomonas phage MP38]AON70308.1 hypothetical protein BG483_03790 [Pseudomonas aeruginosa]AON72788.1 hypothetical protein BG483_16825 [Pseudomonas aeruginosa]EIU2571891.1 hypothetical protein [Pseudomonas aeruginosa]EIU2676573.1 hypothetical protein [Pseudomonas aeruginosa]
MSREKSLGLIDVDCSSANTTSDNASFISSSRPSDSVRSSSSSCNSRNSSSLIMPAPSKTADSIESIALGQAQLDAIHRPLLDDLRHATEFFNSVDGDHASVFNGSRQIAAEWLETAALALGNALIAQHEATGGGHE